MSRTLRRTLAFTVAAMAVSLAQGGASAQEPPTPEPAAARVRILVASFEEIARRADAGLWQSADSAYNDALAAVDALGPGLAAELGPPAASALATVEERLPALVAALDAEDAPAVGAAVALIRTALRPLAPSDVPQGPPPAATAALLAWRTDLAAALASGLDGRWNDMRDASGALAAAIERGTPAVVAAGGDAVALELQRALAFTRRVRAAALDRSADDAITAAAIVERSLSESLRRLSGESNPTATPPVLIGATFRALGVDAEAGSVALVPIVAENIPDVRLGSATLRARWSSAALRLRDVGWEVGQGSVDRGGGAGTAVLSLPHAPTGPSGTAEIARLEFEVLGSAIEARDYLPDEHALLEQRVAAAREMFARADVPLAGREVMRGYLEYAAGQGQGGSLWEALASRGLGGPLERALLTLMDALSLPAAPDVILEAFERMESLSAATAASFVAPLAARGEVPITIDVVEALDTRGEPITVSPSEPGAVRILGAVVSPGGEGVGLPGDVGSPADLAAQGTAAALSGVGSDAEPFVQGTVVGPGTAATAGTAAADDPTGAPRAGQGGIRLPSPLLIALVLAAVAGGAAVWWWSDREAAQQPPEGPG